MISIRSLPLKSSITTPWINITASAWINPFPRLITKPRGNVQEAKPAKKVIEWLKQLENNELRRATKQGQIPYDSRWILKELELTQYLD